jgi:hypothetical protein
MAPSLTTKGAPSKLALIRLIAAWVHVGPSGPFVSLSVADDSFGTDFASLPVEDGDLVSHKMPLAAWNEFAQFVADETGAKLAWKSDTGTTKSKARKAVILSEAEAAKRSKDGDCIVVSNGLVLQMLIELGGIQTKAGKGRRTFVSLYGMLTEVSTREARDGYKLNLRRKA